MKWLTYNILLTTYMVKFVAGKNIQIFNCCHVSLKEQVLEQDTVMPLFPYHTIIQAKYYEFAASITKMTVILCTKIGE